MNNDKLVLGVGLAQELEHAFNRNGFTSLDEIKELTKGDFLGRVRDVQRGILEIKPIEHIIDLGIPAVIPQGYNWTVEEHRIGPPDVKLERKADGLYIDGKKIGFWLSEEQRRKQAVVGNILRAKLKEMPVLNDNVLNYLLKNPLLIPEDWKKDENGNTRYIFFWGTIFRSAVGDLFVRCLCWSGGEWVWDSFWLDNDWRSSHPAAVSAR